MLFSTYILSAFIGLAVANPVAIPEPVPAPATALSRRGDLNDLLSKILDIVPGLLGNINAVASLIPATQTFLALVTGTELTYNQLGNKCTDYTFIFARGTCDAGNVGLFTGAPMVEALQDLVGSSKVLIQGVNNYAADVKGYLDDGDATGSAEL